MSAAAVLLLKAPSAAQIEAGNYKKRHVRFQGLDISIENPKGSVRKGTDRNGHKWRTKMLHHYGYIRGSEGADREHVDCYLGPEKAAETVYVIHQRKAGDWRAYDEDKCMLGFPTQAAAKRAYLAHYDDPRFLGPVTAMPVEKFKARVLAKPKRGQMIKALFLKSDTRFPKVGDPVDFGSDRQTEKGPSAGKITAIDGHRVKVAHSDTEEWFDWPKLKGHWAKRCWLMKARP